MISRILSGVAALSASVLFTVGAMAQETPLSLSEAVAVRYDSLVDMQSRPGILCCAPYRLSNPDGDFVHISAVFDIAWTEEMKDARVSGRDFGLLLPGEEEPRAMFGFFERIGQFRTGAGSIYVRRPRDWPDDDADAYMDGVWLVPEGVTTAKLVIANTDFAQDISIGGEKSEPVAPGSLINVSVGGLKAVDSIEAPYSVSRQEVAGVIGDTSGHILQLDLTIEILGPNDINRENQYFFLVQQFAMVGPNGAPVPFLGALVDDTYQQGYSYSSSWQDDLPSKATNISLLFLGDAAPGDYSIYYLTDRVAETQFDG